MEHISKSILTIMEMIWNKIKKNLTLKELADFSVSCPEPYNNWAKNEIKERG
jgi:hypothetical protein